MPASGRFERAASEKSSLPRPAITCISACDGCGGGAQTGPEPAMTSGVKHACSPDRTRRAASPRLRTVPFVDEVQRALRLGLAEHEAHPRFERSLRKEGYAVAEHDRDD